MKIVIDARTGIGTGIGRYTLNLLEQLQELDDQNEYKVLLQSKDYDNWSPKNANFEKILADFPIYSLSEQTKLPGLLRKLKPDLVHFTSFNVPISYKRPYVVTIHDLTLVNFKNIRGGMQRILYPIKYWAGRLVLSAALKNSRQIITPSHFVKDGLGSRAPADKISVTLEAADKLAAKPEPLDRFNIKDGPLLFYVGNAYPHKNLPRLAEAFALVRHEHPTAQLLIGGQVDFFYNQLSRAATEGMIMPGRPTDGELVSLYQKAALFVFPSLSEGFGLPPLEAMTYGTPVISSDASCMPEILGDAAEYFDPYDTRDMAAKISALLTNQKRLDELKKAGPERAKQFSWRRMAEQTLEIYKK